VVTCTIRRGLLRLPPTVKAEVNTTSAARRVEGYLLVVRSPKTSRNPGSEPNMKRKYATSSPTNFDACIPITKRFELKTFATFHFPIDRRSEYYFRVFDVGVQAVASYRPPSPPTSTFPSVSQVMQWTFILSWTTKKSNFSILR